MLRNTVAPPEGTPFRGMSVRTAVDPTPSKSNPESMLIGGRVNVAVRGVSRSGAGQTSGGRDADSVAVVGLVD